MNETIVNMNIATVSQVGMNETIVNMNIATVSQVGMNETIVNMFLNKHCYSKPGRDE